jgi:hypothetical protein
MACAKGKSGKCSKSEELSRSTKRSRPHLCWHRVGGHLVATTSCTLEEEISMDGIIYLVGLIVIVMAVLSLFGLR